MNKLGASLRGFTVVELMMALAIFSIGVTGIVAMQTITARANLSAKDLATATQLARSWEDRLSMDGQLWGGDNDWAITNTTWLQEIQNGNDGTWILPTASGNFGPAAGPRGEFAAGADAYFCTHIRLTELQAAPYGLVRCDVRVFWPVKGPQAWSNGDPYCVNAANIPDIGSSPNFHFVYNSTVVRQTPKF